jgi:hypothetical protein
MLKQMFVFFCLFEKILVFGLQMVNKHKNSFQETAREIQNAKGTVH